MWSPSLPRYFSERYTPENINASWLCSPVLANATCSELNYINSEVQLVGMEFSAFTHAVPNSPVRLWVWCKKSFAPMSKFYASYLSTLANGDV